MPNLLPHHIKRFVDLFSVLPSLGPRQATRLGFYIKSLGATSIKELAAALAGLIDVRTCKQCFFTYEASGLETNGGPASSSASTPLRQDESQGGLCNICENKKRDHAVIAVVEKETDLISIEKAKKFNGVYLVLGELQKDGTLTIEQRARLASLQKRFTDASAEEIIIATNPTAYGDLNASLIEHELNPIAKKLTHLARGIPTGGEIEFADEETLGGALENRR